MRLRPSFSFPLIFCCAALQSQVHAQIAGESRAQPAVWTLARALERVFARNPELLVSELEIQAAAARVSQAGMKVNPEVEATFENLPFQGFVNGVFPYTESTLQFSQRLELGGKRDLRVKAAQKEVTVASRQLEVRKAELMAAAAQAFAEALSEQQRFANQQELSRLAQQAHGVVVERVAAGKVSPVEQTRSAVALASARLEEERHRRALAAAKERLALLWGGSPSEIEAVQGVFEIPPAAPEIAATCVQNNPELKLAAASTDARDAVLALEMANRKPDLTFSAGLRRLNVEHEQVLVAGVSLPLPVFDKRAGAIAEARVRLDQSRAAETALQWRLRAALAQARQDHAGALVEAAMLRETTLPAAREAAAAVEEGYRLGKFELINVLDSQRTYAELQGRYIEAVANGLRAAIEIERLARCDAPGQPSAPER
jgi:outer membrane protein, heavy metal efflux system